VGTGLVADVDVPGRSTASSPTRRRPSWWAPRRGSVWRVPV